MMVFRFVRADSRLIYCRRTLSCVLPDAAISETMSFQVGTIYPVVEPSVVRNSLVAPGDCRSSRHSSGRAGIVAEMRSGARALNRSKAKPSATRSSKVSLDSGLFESPGLSVCVISPRNHEPFTASSQGNAQSNQADLKCLLNLRP
jgi:hypothetical protein